MSQQPPQPPAQTPAPSLAPTLRPPEPSESSLTETLAPPTVMPTAEVGAAPLTAPAGEAGPATICVPGYEILGELGRGGMGVVYKARQVALGRVVALKMIRDGLLAGGEDVSRFHNEARAIARLQHPNIVQIYETGQHNGRPFFSLEYVEGGTLEERLNGVPIAARQATELVRILALATQGAHEQSIIHRDLKPANVLLTADGTPKIADFGLAKHLQEELLRTQTASNIVLGTPSYMAPEQIGGNSRGIGSSADVYALGGILYELLVARPPFLAETLLETLEQVRFRDPISPHQLVPTVPRDLETICLHCLQKEPARRYASAAALAEDLRRFLAGEPIVARPVSAWELALKWVRRRPAVASLLGAVLLAVGLAGILALEALRHAREAAHSAEAQLQAEEGKKVAEEALRRKDDELREALAKQQTNTAGAIAPRLTPSEVEASLAPLRSAYQGDVGKELFKSLETALKEERVLEAAVCTQCHSLPTPFNRASWDVALFHEWPTWRLKDRHSSAGISLRTEYGRAIGEQLGLDVMKPESGCLSCHSGPGAEESAKQALPLGEGVSCVACHGPANAWVGPHAVKPWRLKKPEEKAQLGMRNLRSPVVRAEVCASCHVGSVQEKRIVTHEMIAAGHPPLVGFEPESALARMPPHWRRLKDVPYLQKSEEEVRRLYGWDRKDVERTEGVMFGNTVVLRASALLLAGAALEGDGSAGRERTIKPTVSWPPLAQFACSSCHSVMTFSFNPELRPTYRRTLGFPWLGDWSWAVVEGCGVIYDQGLGGRLSTLQQAAAVPVFGDRRAVAQAALEVSRDCMKTITDYSQGQRLKIDPHAIAGTLARPLNKNASDFDRVRQLGFALQTILPEVPLSPARLATVKDEMTKLEQLLNLRPDFNRAKRYEAITTALMEIMHPGEVNPVRTGFIQFWNSDKDHFGNEALAQLFLRVGTVEFEKALLSAGTTKKPGTAEILQRLREEERQEARKARATYEPRKVQEMFHKLADALKE